MRLGNVELFVVSDGFVRMDGGGMFGVVPRVLWEKVLAPDEFNRVKTALNCLVIVTRDKTILVDTGLGAKLTAKQERNFARKGGAKLLVNLARIGFLPEDIDLVVNTHLHADHAGGNTYRAGQDILPTFPNAEYWIQRQEFLDASFPNERTRATYFADNFIALERVCLLNGDTQITDEVRAIVTPGHTRAHQAILIESKGEKALFLGDVAGRTIYLEHLPWVPAYDIEPMVSIETKRRIREWAFEENMLLVFQHDAVMTLGRLRQDGKEYRVERVATDL
ncbi:MBL fold metallo-hydrolase [Anaerolineae bacterium CFX7]|nr:MBL fold metallo-hydrolase [Anaerolineae bacterium CFX7]